jgi:hypothetical protein
MRPLYAGERLGRIRENHAMQRTRDNVRRHGKSISHEPLIAAVRQKSSVMNSCDDRYFLSLDSEVWAIREKAFTGLFNEGSRAVATLIAGVSHSRPRVRAACVALMDHLGDERCCKSLERALHDASPLVRRHAVHAIGCQRCKVRPLSIDVVAALIERVLNDTSPRVRRVAVHQLGLQPRDARAIQVLKNVIAESQDAGLVSRARHALGLQQATAEPTDAVVSR